MSALIADRKVVVSFVSLIARRGTVPAKKNTQEKEGRGEEREI